MQWLATFTVLNVLFLSFSLAQADEPPPVPAQSQIPDAEAIKQAGAQVSEAYAEQLKEADAGFFLQQASETKDNVAAKYVLFMTAIDKAQAQGEIANIVEAVRQLAADFQVDATKLLQSSLANYKPDDKVVTAELTVDRPFTETASLADAWWKAATKLTPPQSVQLRYRAGQLYESIKAQLSGITLKLAENRLKEVEKEQNAAKVAGPKKPKAKTPPAKTVTIWQNQDGETIRQFPDGTGMNVDLKGNQKPFRWARNGNVVTRTWLMNDWAEQLTLAPDGKSMAGVAKSGSGTTKVSSVLVGTEEVREEKEQAAVKAAEKNAPKLEKARQVTTVWQSPGSIFRLQPDGTGVELYTRPGAPPQIAHQFQWQRDGNAVTMQWTTANHICKFTVAPDGRSMSGFAGPPNKMEPKSVVLVRTEAVPAHKK